MLLELKGKLISEQFLPWLMVSNSSPILPACSCSPSSLSPTMPIHTSTFSRFHHWSHRIKDACILISVLLLLTCTDSSKFTPISGPRRTQENLPVACNVFWSGYGDVFGCSLSIIGHQWRNGCRFHPPPPPSRSTSRLLLEFVKNRPLDGSTRLGLVLPSNDLCNDDGVTLSEMAFYEFS